MRSSWRRRFTEAGLPSLAVSANTDSDDAPRRSAKLRAGRVRALFAVDLFNEGVDLPEVDTLLFLRPTESALVFLQQLGRGLRRFEGKDCVTVLDFIGQAHQQFRFDLRYRAVTGATRTEVEKQIEQGFPFLPAGCSMQLDRVATDIVLRNIRSAIPSRRPAMVARAASAAGVRSVPRPRAAAAGVPGRDRAGGGGRLQVRLLVRPEAGGGRGGARARPARGDAAATPSSGCSTWRTRCGLPPTRRRCASASTTGLDEPTRRLLVGPALRTDAVRGRPGHAGGVARPAPRASGHRPGAVASCCRCWTTSPTTSPTRWTRSWAGTHRDPALRARAPHGCVTS